MNTRQRGKEWEQKVCRYLKDKGYFIVDVNFACACGEIDIIAAQRQTLVFIEVKYRRNARYGYALEAVTPAKQKKIRRTADVYLAKHAQNTVFAGADCRFDADYLRTQLKLLQNRHREPGKFELIKRRFKNGKEASKNLHK